MFLPFLLAAALSFETASILHGSTGGRRQIDMRAALFLLTLPVFAQTFDVASVHQLRDVRPGYGNEIVEVHPGSLAMHNIRLRAAVRWAYGLQEFQVSAPAWMGSPGWQGPDLARFEITAKAPAGTPVAQLRLMLQALLAERFHLAVHHETREMPVYILTSFKDRPGLKPSGDTEARSTASGNNTVFTLHHTTLAEFAEFLAGPLHTPVLDRTDRPGRFEISIDLARYHDVEYTSLPTAVEEELGLKLQRQKTPVEILVVDHIDRTPTEN
jgi:uncharacterized protein (TIGR03435 family)